MRYVVDELATDGRRDGDEPVGDLREEAFERHEKARRPRTEIPVQHVAVIRVHDARAWGRAPRQIERRRGNASKQPCLGHVRMHDARLQLFEGAVQLQQSPQIVERREWTPQPRQEQGTRRPWEHRCHITLVGTKPAMNEGGGKAERFEASREAYGLSCGAADVQPRDDACDGHWRRAWKRVGQRHPSETGTILLERVQDR